MLKYSLPKSDSKLLSEFLFIVHGNPDNNLELLCRCLPLYAWATIGRHQKAQSTL
jgi:hypothetical protein